MTIQDVISIVHFMAFGVYFGFAMLVITQNFKDKINKVFGSILMLLSVWAYSFSIANSALEYETALLWRKVGSIGWGLVYSFVLHLLLMMVSDEQIRLVRFLKSRLGLILIYGSGFFNVLVYLILKNVADKQFRLLWSQYGWISIGSGTLISNYFNLYVGVTLALSLWVSFLWIKQLRNSKGIRQSYAIIISFFAAAFIGVIVDIIATNMLGIALVQVSILVGVIPVLTIFLTSNQFRFAPDAIISEESKGFHLIPQGSRRDIAFYMSGMVYIGALSSFVFRFFIYDESLFIASIYSIGLFGMAAVLYLIPLLNFTDERKDFWVLMTITVFIPYVLFHFASVDAAVTIWVMPVFLILLSVVFYSRLATYMITGVTVITLALIGGFNPITHKTLYIEEHLLRIGIVLVFTWLSLYVRRLYIKRLRENERQYKVQKMIADISTDVLFIDERDSLHKLDHIFKRIGETAEVDLIFVIDMEDPSQEIVYQQRWSEDGNPSFIRKFPDVLEPIKKIVDSEKSILIQKVSGIPSNYRLVKDMLEVLDIQSAVMYPILVEDKLSGIFGMAYTWPKKVFPVKMLRSIRQRPIFFLMLIRRQEPQGRFMTLPIMIS